MFSRGVSGSKIACVYYSLHGVSRQIDDVELLSSFAINVTAAEFKYLMQSYYYSYSKTVYQHNYTLKAETHTQIIFIENMNIPSEHDAYKHKMLQRLPWQLDRRFHFIVMRLHHIYTLCRLCVACECGAAHSRRVRTKNLNIESYYIRFLSFSQSIYSMFEVYTYDVTFTSLTLSAKTWKGNLLINIVVSLARASIYIYVYIRHRIEYSLTPYLLIAI